MAILRFNDSSFDRYGLEVSMEAFSPFVVGDVVRSSIPSIILRFRFRNKGSKELSLSLMGIMRNPPHNINDQTMTRNRAISSPRYSGVAMNGGVNLPTSHGMHGGELGGLVYVDGVDSGASFELDRKDRESLVLSLRSIFVDFRGGDGLINGSIDAEATGYDLYSMLTRLIRLKPGEEKTLVAIIAWFYPNHIDHGQRVGHYYENMFSNLSDVLDYVAANHDSLYADVRKFVDNIYNINYDEWIIDLAMSQLTTFAKSSWFTKNGFFGIWEGGPGCCGISTLDVALWGGSVGGVNLLFPDLAKRIVIEFSRHILTPEESPPQYELFTLAFPSNMNMYREALRSDPSIQHDRDKLMSVIRSIAEKGVDPSGRVPHAFRGGSSEIDSYDRNDLMPEYILLSLLSYRWTGGDRDYLRSIWPSIGIVMNAMLRQHDDAKTGGLPYHTLPSGYEGYSQVAGMIGRNQREADLLRQLMSGPMYFPPTTVNTFDAMSLFGIALFTSDLWLAALRAIREIGTEAGDESLSKTVDEIYDRAVSNMVKLLWNGKYFDLWRDPPVTGLRDEACMTAGLTGEWYLNQLLGIGYSIDRDKVISMLRAIYEYNYKENEGLLNATYPGKPRPSLSGDMKYFNGLGIPYRISSQMDTPWTGVEIQVAEHMMWEGMIKEGLEILRNVHERYLHYGIYWNHIECDGHYFRPLVSMDIPNALAGFRYVGSLGLVLIKPRLQDLKGPVLAPGFVGSLISSGRSISISGVLGSLRINAVNVFNAKVTSISINGKPVKFSYGKDEAYCSMNPSRWEAATPLPWSCNDKYLFIF